MSRAAHLPGLESTCESPADRQGVTVRQGRAAGDGVSKLLTYVVKDHLFPDFGPHGYSTLQFANGWRCEVCKFTGFCFPHDALARSLPQTGTESNA